MPGRIAWITVYGSTENFIGAGGEAVNAQVCKTCIRGFNSRPALQKSATDFPVLESEVQIDLRFSMNHHPSIGDVAISC